MSMRSYLLARIDPRTLARAEEYFRGGNIVDIEEESPGFFTARVRGSGRRPYTVEILLNSGVDGPNSRIIESYCSCPVGYMCKHAIACYLAINASTVAPSDALTGPNVTRSSPLLAAKKMQLSPKSWLEQASKAMGPKTPPAEHEQHPTRLDASKQRILFVLTICHGAALGYVPRVVMFRGTLRANGGYGRMLPLTDVPPKLVTKLDKVALTCLQQASQPAATAYDANGKPDTAYGQISLLIKGPGAIRALEALAATGRLYYHGAEGPVVKSAPPRWAKLAWTRDESMAQKLGLVLEPAARFQIMEDVPYFFDIEACAMGRIVTDVHPDLLHQLAEAPAISPEDAASFAASIPQALAAQLPAPEVLPIRDSFVAPAVRVAVSEIADAQGKKQLVGDLRYSYEGVDVAAGHDSKVVYRRDEKGITRIKRHRGKEQAARKQLVRASNVKQPRGVTAVHLGPCADKQAYFEMAEKVFAPLQASGWQVEGDLAPKGQVTAVDDENPDAAMQESRLNGWFELDMGIMVGQKRVTLPPLLMRLIKDPAWGLNTAALNASGRKTVFVPISDDDVVSMPTDRIIDLLAMLESLGDMAEMHEGKLRVPLSDAHLLLDLQRRDRLNLRAPEGLARLAEILREGAEPPIIEPPVGLNAQLRGYQIQGVSWLQMLRANALGGVLADDMGLGKTLQALTHILLEKQAGRLEHKALIVCPTSVLGTWVEACSRFTPELRLKLHHGTQRGFDSRDEFDVLVTTYGTLLRDAEMLSEAPWAVYVLDEAQMVKNALSKSYIAACRVPAGQHIALTGTPLENGLRELWAVVNWAMPGLLNTRQKFETQFVKPIELGADVNRRTALVSRLRPFLMRRTKAQVMQELPEKTEIIEHVELGQKQRDLYEVVRASLDKKVRESIQSQGMSRSMLTVLDALLKLRQVCCDPRLVKNVKIPKNCGTAKLERLFELLPDLIESGRRVLIFSQFTSMLELIEVELTSLGIGYCKLTGQTRKRDAVVEAFRCGDAPIFLISLKAGGTGLNLPEADTVIHYDPWWNPAVEDQATSRVHRMGQKKAVFVYKMVVEGSVEAKILQLQEHKRSLFAALLEGRELGGKLTEKDIDSLFAPLA